MLWDSESAAWTQPPAFAPLRNEYTVKIGIIGSGNIGGTLARRLTALGHDVSVANSRGPESLSELAAGLVPHPCPSPRSARVPTWWCWQSLRKASWT